jgi:hypothetical protein
VLVPEDIILKIQFIFVQRLESSLRIIDSGRGSVTVVTKTLAGYWRVGARHPAGQDTFVFTTIRTIALG